MSLSPFETSAPIHNPYSTTICQHSFFSLETRKLSGMRMGPTEAVMKSAGPSQPVSPDCTVSALQVSHWAQQWSSGWAHVSAHVLETEISSPAKVLPAQCLCSHSSPGGKLDRSSGYIWQRASSAAASWGSSWALKQKADRKALDKADLWKVKGRLDTRQPKRSHKIHEKNWHKSIIYDFSNAGSDHSWPDLARTRWIGPNLLYPIIWLCTDMA